MNEHEMLKDRFVAQVFKGKKRELPVAIEIAYADMARRQTGHTPAIKNVCFEWLVKSVFAYTDSISDFDAWHKETCEALVSKWNAVKGSFGTVGRAQKVINMAFNYLSCISGNYSQLLPHCHMTLDSYTLAWYKKKVRPWAEIKGRPDVKILVEWSKINDYGDYMLIQANIREYLKTDATYAITLDSRTTKLIPLSQVPIEAEFVIWEGQIIEAKYLNLIKELNKYISGHRGSPAGKTYDSWLLGDIFSDYLKAYCQKI